MRVVINDPTVYVWWVPLTYKTPQTTSIIWINQTNTPGVNFGVAANQWLLVNVEQKGKFPQQHLITTLSESHLHPFIRLLPRQVRFDQLRPPSWSADQGSHTNLYQQSSTAAWRRFQLGPAWTHFLQWCIRLDPLSAQRTSLFTLARRSSRTRLHPLPDAQQPCVWWLACKFISHFFKKIG